MKRIVITAALLGLVFSAHAADVRLRCRHRGLRHLHGPGGRGLPGGPGAVHPLLHPAARLLRARGHAHAVCSAAARAREERVDFPAVVAL